MKVRKLLIAASGLTLSAITSSTLAYDLPPVNLGFTSFLDGAPPAGGGWYFTQYIQDYSADKFRDKNGNELGLPDPNVDVTVSLSQGIYISDKEFLGGKLGIDVILPYVMPDTSYAVDNPAFPNAGKSGFGDLLIGPLIQWDPIMGANGPKFMHRLELQVIAPTGKYDNDKAINPGSNIWSFNPYWSGTYFFTPDWTASVRAHYLWNGKNNDPFGGASSIRPGQAFHTNFATEYALTPWLRFGLNGYYLKQTTDSEINGNKVSGRKEKVLGLGVGGVLSMNKDNHIFFNFFNESNVENRTEGERVNLRYVHHF